MNEGPSHALFCAWSVRRVQSRPRGSPVPCTQVGGNTDPHQGTRTFQVLPRFSQASSAERTRLPCAVYLRRAFCDDPPFFKMPKSKRSGSGSKVYVRRKRVSTYKRNPRYGGFVAIEKKFKDNFYQANLTDDLTTSVHDPGPNTRPLNGIALGTGEGDRVGRVTQVTSVHLRGHVQFPAQVFAGPGGGTTGKVRLLLVVDHQSNAATMSAVDVLSNITGTIHDSEAFFNLQNTGRFSILRDLTLDEGSKGLTWDGASYVTQSKLRSFRIDHYFKSPMKVMHQSAGTNTYSSIRTNQIHVIATMFHASGGILTYTSRVRFLDA